MNEIKDFDSLYQELRTTLSEADLIEIEKKRKQNKAIQGLIKVFIGVFILMFFGNQITSFFTALTVKNSLAKEGLSVGSFFTSGLFTPIIIFLILLVVVLVTKKYSIKGSKEKRYAVFSSPLFKSKVIPKLIRGVYSDGIYTVGNGIGRYVYSPNLYYERCDRFRSEDLVQVPSKNLIFSEVISEQEHTDDDGHTSYTVVFHGIAGKRKLKTDIKGSISVTKNDAIFSGKKVKMDVSEFEKYYNVFTENKMLAMQFLTADVMLEILTMSKDNYWCEFNITNNDLYFRIRTSSVFELRTNADTLDYQMLKDYYDILTFIDRFTTYLEESAKEIIS